MTSIAMLRANLVELADHVREERERGWVGHDQE